MRWSSCTAWACTAWGWSATVGGGSGNSAGRDATVAGGNSNNGGADWILLAGDLTATTYPVDVNSMSAVIHADGAMTFSWSLSNA